MAVYALHRTDEFLAWLDGLKDVQAIAKIAARLARLELGNLGDHKRFSGLIELRIPHGPGYRLYCIERNKTWIVVLGGGTKASQTWDIERAITRAEEYDGKARR